MEDGEWSNVWDVSPIRERALLRLTRAPRRPLPPIKPSRGALGVRTPHYGGSPRH